MLYWHCSCLSICFIINCSDFAFCHWQTFLSIFHHFLVLAQISPIGHPWHHCLWVWRWFLSEKCQKTLWSQILLNLKETFWPDFLKSSIFVAMRNLLSPGALTWWREMLIYQHSQRSALKNEGFIFSLKISLSGLMRFKRIILVATLGSWKILRRGLS